MNTNKIYQGNALSVLKDFPDESIDCIVTSPPYFGLRNYNLEPIIFNEDKNCEHEFELKEKKDTMDRGGSGDHDSDGLHGNKIEYKNYKSGYCKKCNAWLGFLGNEGTPQEYINHIVEIVSECMRVLKKTGVMFLNLGDSYGTHRSEKDAEMNISNKDRLNSLITRNAPKKDVKSNWFREKQKLLIPHRIAIALQEKGFIIRDDIVWVKKLCVYPDKKSKGSTMPFPVCLHPNTKVFIKENEEINQVFIKDTKIGQFILTPDGWKSIKNKWFTKEEGIKFQYGTCGNVICGKNHPFPISHENRRINYDLIKIKDIKDDKNKTQRLLFKPIKEFLNENINEKDYQDGRFFGIIISEGNFINFNRGIITINKDENDIMDFFTNYLKNKFINYKIKKIKNYQNCFFNSTDLKNIYNNLCNEKCKNKYLNRKLILNSSYSFRKGIFDGMIEGDGHNKNRRISYTSASKRLLDDICLIASSLGFVYSKHHNKQYDKRTKKIYESYTMTIPTKKIQVDILKGFTLKKQCKYHKRIYNKEILYKTLKFKKIEDLDKQEMIDIEVDGGLFIIEDGLITHNCDKFLPATEYIFQIVKSNKYFFNLDPIKTEIKNSTIERAKRPISSTYTNDIEGNPYNKHGGMSNFYNKIADNYIEDNKSARRTRTKVNLCVGKKGYTNWNVDTGKKNYVGPNDKEDAIGDIRKINTQKANPTNAIMFRRINQHSKKVVQEHFASYPITLTDTLIEVGCPKFICNKCKKIREIKKVPMEEFEYIENPKVILKNNKPYAVKERESFIEVRDLPNINELVDYLNKKKNEVGLSIEEIKKRIGNQAVHHWFSKESYPKKEDYEKIKKLLKLDNRFDKNLLEIKYKSAKKLETKYKDKIISCSCNVGFSGGICLDPFFGSGTTGISALKQGKKFIGIELNPKYIEISKKRLKPYLSQLKLEEFFENI